MCPNPNPNFNLSRLTHRVVLGLLPANAWFRGMPLHTYIHTFIHTLINTYGKMYVHTLIIIEVLVRISFNIYMHIYTYIHSYIDTYTIQNNTVYSYIHVFHSRPGSSDSYSHTITPWPYPSSGDSCWAWVPYPYSLPPCCSGSKSTSSERMVSISFSCMYGLHGLFRIFLEILIYSMWRLR